LREKGFSPGSDEALGIEVLRVKRPEAHGVR
jgi:hypothetical protein